MTMICVHLKIYSEIGIRIDKHVCLKKLVHWTMLQSSCFKLKAEIFNILRKKPQVA